MECLSEFGNLHTDTFVSNFSHSAALPSIWT